MAIDLSYSRMVVAANTIPELWLRIEHQRESFRAPCVLIGADVPILLGREQFTTTTTSSSTAGTTGSN